MTVGLFFGSFNPLHKAHLQLAEAFFQSTSMDELWWMVSPQNPHKKPEDLAPFSHRIQMLRDAVQTEHFKVSDFESTLPSPSYTIDTLAALSAKFPNAKWKILMGQDSWNALPTWKCGDDIEKRFEIWVYGRPESTTWRAGNFNALDLTPLPISSTQIRAQIQDQTPLEQIESLLPVTQAYIAKHQLYQAK